ncbi:MAG: bile acid:sodium symporter [Candidatus Eremiobacteraeota bacterium]|nr:bile acid:sodium symporter [Candidatus Eremiobacteraeota bacterium]
MLNIGIICMLVALMLWAGLQCTLGDLRAALSDYVFAIRAIVLSVVVVPLLALAFCRLLHIGPDFEVGILMMAVSGGVPFLPLAVRTAGGDMRAAVALVFLLSLVGVFTAPITIAVLAAQIEIHELPVKAFIVKLLVLQFLPLVVGMVIGSIAKPGLVGVLVRLFQVITYASIAVVLVILAPKIGQAFVTVFATGTILTIALVIGTSMIIAWFFGGRDLGKRKDLTDAIGLRNPALALLLAQASDPGPLANSAIIAYLVLQIVADQVAAPLMKRATS